ncbi:unnamed protein product [Orchesella dallaii]|uniref:BTB domain-containing protein n=1 Tax=Orchesella dallaii TaxID=48710 RepID=A0ABP1S3X0_9HEXA
MSTSAKPSAPRLELLEHHYGSETGCDVVFLVGRESSQENCLRIPAHSHVLKEATPVFGAMFSNNFFIQRQQQQQDAGLIENGSESTSETNEQNVITPQPIFVSDLDGKAFDNLMKYLYDSQVILQSVETTIETLKAAHKYQCAGLARKCVNHLIGLISVDNVLLISANVAMLCGDFQNLENLCREAKEGDSTTFPQLVQRRLSEANSELNIELDCAWLVYNCLSFIDRNAVAVLQSDEIEDLSVSTIHHIMSRDTLDVKEGLVFNALVRWADKECKRQHLPLTSESKRKVLQDLLYLPRYLRMEASDFRSGPAASGLLTPEEVETLTHLIQIGPDSVSPSPESSPFKRIQALGIPTSKSLRIHLGYLLRPRRKPVDQKQGNDMGSGCGANPYGSWKWVARLKKMRCCLLCCESRGSSRCPSPSISSPVRRSSEPRLSISSGTRRENKVGLVERAVVIFACLFD